MENIKATDSKGIAENKNVYNINSNTASNSENIISNSQDRIDMDIEGNIFKYSNHNSLVNPSYIQNNNSNNINNQIHQTYFKLTKKLIMDSFNNQSTTMIYQKLLMEAKDETIKSIVSDLKGEYRIIINNKNGNHFANDLFKICSQKERIEILEELSPILSQDCNNTYATHPIQTLIEFSSCELEYKLILFSFNDYNKLLFAALNPNGAYTIQKIIERIPERYRSEFNLIFISFVSFVSKQKFGIVTVKKFISCTKNEDTTIKILDYIKQNFMGLAIDKYGNYLIQFVLEKWNNFPEGKEIKDLVIQNFKTMIQFKYSSFICEAIIKISKKEKININELLNLNNIGKIDNPYSIKIMKLLGIDIDINSNDFQNQIQYPLKYINMNNMLSDYSKNQNLLINNNIENKYYNNIKIKKQKNNNNIKTFQ